MIEQPTAVNAAIEIFISSLLVYVGAPDQTTLPTPRQLVKKESLAMTETRSKGLGQGNTKRVEELIQWFVDEYNKGRGYAKVVLHPEGTLTERPSAQYPQGRKVDLAGLAGMEDRQLALQPDRVWQPQWITALEEEGHGLIQYTHVGHTVDGTELVFFGLSTIKFVDDLVHTWVDTVVRFKREKGTTELIPY